jgi:hypothetical protein
MSEKKKIIEAGFRFEIESYEDDGDNSKTIIKTVKTQEEVLAVQELLEFVHLGGAIGNTYEDFSNEQLYSIKEFVNKNPLLFEKSLQSGRFDVTYDDSLQELFTTIVSEYLGDGEFICRCCKKYSITYSEEDVYCEIIK